MLWILKRLSLTSPGVLTKSIEQNIQQWEWVVNFFTICCSHTRLVRMLLPAFSWNNNKEEEYLHTNCVKWTCMSLDIEHKRQAWLFSPVSFRPVLTWRVGTPKDPTCSHTICSGTIPLLSLLLAPFTQCTTALDQSGTASLTVSLGNRLAAWFSKVLVSHSPPPLFSIVLYASCTPSIFPQSLPLHLVSLYLSH